VALAHYLGRGQSELFPRLELKRDLGLEPLDVIWFITAFEELDERGFPFEKLEHVTVVGQLVQLISDWLDDYDHSELLAADEELFGVNHQSGTWRAVRHVAAE